MNPFEPNSQPENSNPSDFQNPYADGGSAASNGKPKSHHDHSRFEIPNPQSSTFENPFPSQPTPGPNPQAQSPRAGGRPRALDDVKCREVCALISAGCGIERAAQYVGCAPSTIRREAMRNLEFNEALRRAHLTAELTPLNAMRNAAHKYWRAAAWLLERTNPQRFARQKPDVVSPELLDEFCAKIADIVTDAIPDEAAQLRILRQVDAQIRRANRDIWATKLDPCPKPRRRRP